MHKKDDDLWFWLCKVRKVLWLLHFFFEPPPTKHQNKSGSFFGKDHLNKLATFWNKMLFAFHLYTFAKTTPAERELTAETLKMNSENEKLL